MSINVNDKNLGHATAYAYYKAGGGTMTEAEFTEFMADFGTASQTAVEAAQAALASETAARNASTTATNKASEATTAAQTATTAAESAQADADAAALDASQALSAASTATTKASEATTAAATATSAATTATTAKDDAVSAKTAAQTARAGAETAAASVAESAAQIQTNAEDISQLKSLLSLDFNTIANTFINKNNGGTGTSTGYVASDYVPCNGYVYLYTYTGNDNSGYAFYDKDKQPLSYGGTYEIRRVWTKLTAPSGAVYFRATCGVNQVSEFQIKLPIGENVAYLIENEATTRATANAVKSIVEEESYTFKNNMSTDGLSNLPNCTIYRNGSASPSNYGLSGSSYTFQMPQKKLHIYYEFKQTDAIANSASSVVTRRLVQAFATGYFIINYSGSLFLDGELFQRFAIQCVSGSNSETLLLNSINYKRMQGEDAISVKYTNIVTSNSVCTITFTDSAVNVNVDGTTTSISCSASTTLTEMVTALNAISGLSAEVIIAEDKTYGDLLPVVSKSSSTYTDINLLYNGTLYDQTSYTDAITVYIPLAVNNDWHSVEMIYDPDGKVSAAFDGITVSVDYGNTTPNTTLALNSQYAPVVIRNLEVDFDSAGDAELVDNLIDPTVAPVKKQLISKHNPRLLVYEGHGVDVCSDADAPLTDEMACSTERLRILFERARANGYIPVTWGQIVDWKKKGTPLPKRCFTLMFDDWRLDIYADYDKRKPFIDFGVKPGLAVITSGHPLTESMEFNGRTYQVQQIVDMIMNNGWYPTSHTSTHRRMTDYTPGATETLLKTDVLDADLYRIHSDVLVYPYGDIDAAYMSVLKHSDFAIGVNVVKNHYNCRGTSDYYLTRVEIGTRVPLTTVLYPLV